MRTKDVKPTFFVSKQRCDRCGAEATHDADEGFNNFLQIEFDGSWGSSIGDGTHVEVDLCHSCLKQTLGPWLRLSTSGWAQSHRADSPDDCLLDPPQSGRKSSGGSQPRRRPRDRLVAAV